MAARQGVDRVAKGKATHGKHAASADAQSPVEPSSRSGASAPNWIEELPRSVRVVGAAVGIFACYGCAGVVQEWLVVAGVRNTSALSLSVSATTWLFGVILALCGAPGGEGVLRPSRAAAPMRLHAAVGILSMTTIGLSNLSLLYLNYPTQLLFKSSKVLPVMLGSVLVNRAKFWASEYAAALSLAVGLVVFTLADARSSPQFDAMGVVIIFGALCADAFVSNTQERVLVRHNCSTLEALSLANGIATLVWLALIAVRGDTADVLATFGMGPRVLGALLMYGLSNYVGFWFILYSVGSFSASTTATITSLRKAFTMVLSYLLFPSPNKSFTVQHGFGLALIVCAVYATTRIKNAKRAARRRSARPSDARSGDVELGGETMREGPAALETSPMATNGNGARHFDVVREGSSGEDASRAVEHRRLLPEASRNAAR